MGKLLAFLGFPYSDWQKKEKFGIPRSLAQEHETQLCGESGVQHQPWYSRSLCARLALCSGNRAGDGISISRSLKQGWKNNTGDSLNAKSQRTAQTCSLSLICFVASW